MSAVLVLAAGLAGVTLAFFFYGGLWWTVRQLPRSAHPALLIVASYWARLIVVVAAFVFLSKSGFAAASIALGSFIFGRLVVSRVVASRRIGCT